MIQQSEPFQDWNCATNISPPLSVDPFHCNIRKGHWFTRIHSWYSLWLSGSQYSKKIGLFGTPSLTAKTFASMCFNTTYPCCLAHLRQLGKRGMCVCGRSHAPECADERVKWGVAPGGTLTLCCSFPLPSHIVLLLTLNHLSAHYIDAANSVTSWRLSAFLTNDFWWEFNLFSGVKPTPDWNYSVFRHLLERIPVHCICMTHGFNKSYLAVVY